MAYYAELDINNIVINIRTGASENILDMEQIYLERFQNVHKRTSYNTRAGTSYNTSGGVHKNDQSKSFRKNFAGVGYTYDKNRDAFIPPKQYKSWTLDEETCWWIPPIPFPEDGTKTYEWDEETQTWTEMIDA